MKELKIRGLGSVLHTGTEEEFEEQKKLLNARVDFVAKYCQERGWPVPGEPGFEERITMEQVMEIRSQPGWKNPLEQEDPRETSVVLTHDGAVIVPKGKN